MRKQNTIVRYILLLTLLAVYWGNSSLFAQNKKLSTIEKQFEKLKAEGKQRVIVKFKDEIDPSVIKKYGRYKKSLKIIYAAVAEVDIDKIEQLKAESAVESVIPDAIIKIPEVSRTSAGGTGISQMQMLEQGESSEPNILVGWNLQYEGTNATGAWEEYPRLDGNGAIIAILDTGVNYTLEDLDEPYYLGGYDVVNDDNDPMDDNWADYGHGTTVAAVALAQGDDQIIGLAPKASYYAVKVYPSDGGGQISDAIDGIDWCVNVADPKPDIISMSFGVYPGGILWPSLSIEWEEAINTAYEAGILLVAASGNDGYSYSSYPAAYQNVISVGGHAEDQTLYDYDGRSSNGSVDLVAPGEGIPSIDIYGEVYNPDTGNPWLYDGTSMAAPHVSGLATLIIQHARQNNIEVNNGYIWECLKHSAVDLPLITDPVYEGKGKAWAAESLSVPDPNDGAIDLLANNWPISHQFAFSDYAYMEYNCPVYPIDSEVNQTITLTNITDVLGNTTETIENLTVTVSHVYADEPNFPSLPGDSTVVFTNLTIPAGQSNALLLHNTYNLSPGTVPGRVKTQLSMEFNFTGDSRSMTVEYDSPDSLWYAGIPVLENDIAVFHCSMESVEDIEDCNGLITGDLNVSEGSIGNGTLFSCIGSNCPSVAFDVNSINSEHGSISLSFKWDPNDPSGGLWQIGNHGEPNSLALFYTDDDLFFEIKDTNNMMQAQAPNSLSSEYFTHILATWDNREGNCVIKLFVNGQYDDGQSQQFPGEFLPNDANLVIGYSSHSSHGQGIIDEVSFYDWALVDPEVYPEYVYSTQRFLKQEKTKPAPDPNAPVQILSQDMLKVHGQDFKIKGVGYQPLAIGMENNEHTLREVLTDPNIITRDVAYLKEMNTNTVRLWADLPVANMMLLDALYNEGIYAILGIGVPHEDIDYADPNTISEYVNKTENYVSAYKNHPAVLAWALGNEININCDKEDLSSWYNLANMMAKKAYEVEGDQYHPVMIINAWTVYMGDEDFGSTDPNLNYVDMWGLNLYTRKEYHEFFNFYEKITTKPLIITEFGIDSYDFSSGMDYPSVQADWVVREWQQISENSCGGIVMEYCDEWWKGGDPWTQDPNGGYADTHPDNFSNEEYYGIMAVENVGSDYDIMLPKEVYCALQQAFSERYCVADVTDDQSVNIDDLAELSNWWLFDDCFNNNCCGGGNDLNHDNVVNIVDLSIFSQYWLKE